MPAPPSRKTLAVRTAAVLGGTAMLALVLVSPKVDSPDETGATHPLIGQAPRAHQDVIALLDGLKPGDSLGSVKVLAIDAPRDRIVYIHLGTADAAFSVGVGAAGSGDKRPPVTTDKYELGHGNVRGDGTLPAEALPNATDDIAARIRRTEHRVPLPQGM